MTEGAGQSTGGDKGLNGLRPVAKSLTIVGFVGVVSELALGATGALFVLQGQRAPDIVSFLFVGIGLFLFSIFVIHFQFVDPGLFTNSKLAADPDRPMGRMFLAVFFGYMLVVAAAVVAVDRLVQGQQPVTSGLLTNQHTEGQLLLTVQTATSYVVPPINDGPIPVPFNVTIGFIGTTPSSFSGRAVFTVERLDPPLGLVRGQTGSISLDNATRMGGIGLAFDPRGGFVSQAYNIFYAIQYNISVPGLGNFTNNLKESIVVNVEGRGLTSGWYLFFIFAGILLSFWWRISNSIIEGTFNTPAHEDRRAAYLLLLPVFSSIIALVIFQQFERPGTQVDFLSSAIAGFVYGFFWESATEKIGRTIKVAI